MDKEVFRKCVPLFQVVLVRAGGVFRSAAGLDAGFAGVVCGVEEGGAADAAGAGHGEPAGRGGAALADLAAAVAVRAVADARRGVLTGETEPAKMVAAFREHMTSGLIGIKLDEEGCYLDDGRTRVRVPAAKIKVVDTTGGGGYVVRRADDGADEGDASRAGGQASPIARPRIAARRWGLRRGCGRLRIRWRGCDSVIAATSKRVSTSEVERDGFAIVPSVIPAPHVAALHRRGRELRTLPRRRPREGRVHVRRPPICEMIPAVRGSRIGRRSGI